MNTIVKCLLIAITIISVVSCNKIPSDPIKGAEQYVDKMEELASKKDYTEAEKLTGEYLKKYSKQELTTFFLEILSEFSNPETRQHVGEFIANADLEKNPNLLEFMRWYMATDTAAKNNVTYSRTGRETAELFCSLLADYAKEENFEEAKATIKKLTEHYVREIDSTSVDFYDETQAEAFEFCVTLKQYLTPEVWQFLNDPRMDSEEYHNFQMMCLAGIQTSEQ
jgi:hypothetical protein